MSKESDLMNAREESVAFYYELGRAITAWAHVELALFWVVSTCFTKHDNGRAAIGFFSIENFRAKLQFADHVFAAKHGGTKHVKTWTGFVAKMRKLSKRRNKLAHLCVIGYPLAPAGRRWALIPRIQKNPRPQDRPGEPPPDAMCICDVHHAGRQFSALAFALEAFYYRIVRKPNPLPESFARAGDPPTIHNLTPRIRAALYGPHSPSAASP
jgi:hypothetical protein